MKFKKTMAGLAAAAALVVSGAPAGAIGEDIRYIDTKSTHLDNNTYNGAWAMSDWEYYGYYPPGYRRCWVARSGFLNDGTLMSPVTVAVTVGRTRTRLGEEGCQYVNPTSQGTLTVFDYTFQNVQKTKTRTVRHELKTYLL